MSNDKQNNDFVLEKVMDVVSNNFGVTVERLKSNSRKAPLPDARHVVIYVSRLLTANNISLNYVCDSMNRIHCTGIHGVKKVKGLIETNKVFKSRIDDIIGLCKQELEC
jgi:chromosomal replication initiation ATPase DnaA